MGPRVTLKNPWIVFMENNWQRTDHMRFNFSMKRFHGFAPYPCYSTKLDSWDREWHWRTHESCSWVIPDKGRTTWDFGNPVNRSSLGCYLVYFSMKRFHGFSPYTFLCTKIDSWECTWHESCSWESVIKSFHDNLFVLSLLLASVNAIPSNSEVSVLFFM